MQSRGQGEELGKKKRGPKSYVSPKNDRRGKNRQADDAVDGGEKEKGNGVKWGGGGGVHFVGGAGKKKVKRVVSIKVSMPITKGVGGCC